MLQSTIPTGKYLFPDRTEFRTLIKKSFSLPEPYTQLLNYETVLGL